MEQLVGPNGQVKDTSMFMCNCFGELLMMEVDFDIEDLVAVAGASETTNKSVKPQGDLHISMWHRGLRYPMDLREKLRWCWHILKTGKPWTDSIIVSRTQVLEITHFMESLIENDCLK